MSSRAPSLHLAATSVPHSFHFCMQRKVQQSGAVYSGYIPKPPKSSGLYSVDCCLFHSSSLSDVIIYGMCCNLDTPGKAVVYECVIIFINKAESSTYCGRIVSFYFTHPGKLSPLQQYWCLPLFNPVALPFVWRFMLSSHLIDSTWLCSSCFSVNAATHQTFGEVQLWAWFIGRNVGSTKHVDLLIVTRCWRFIVN